MLPCQKSFGVFMELPEGALIRQEHIVRDLQFPTDVKHTRRSLVRWLALSLGLISPKESRQLLLDILDALFWFHFQKEEPDIHSILAKVGEIRAEAGVNPKAVRYHLLQLKKAEIIECRKRKYRFALPPMQEDADLAAALEYSYMKNAKNAFEKIRVALQALSRTY